MNSILEQDLNNIVSHDIPWEYFNDKTVAITGATGMLASYMVETLLYLNKTHNIKVRVLALSRDVLRAKEQYSHHEDNIYLQHVFADMNQPIHLDEKVDIMIHTASFASPKYYKSSPVHTIKPNVIGTSNLLDICVEKNVEKFLLFSSGEIYGEANTSESLLTEDNYGVIDPLKPRSCYAVSKKMAETMCIAWAEQYGIDVKIVRPFHTYGPGMRLADGRVFSDFVSNIINKENIVLKSDGMFSRPFCYISDATKAFFAVLLKGETKHAYNVANPDQNIKIRDLANILVDVFSDRGISVEYSSHSDKDTFTSKTSEQLPSISKLIKLGWEPMIDVREGFYRTVMSYE